MASASSQPSPSSEDTLFLQLITPLDDDRPVFVVGNFNGWQENDEKFRMLKKSYGRYEFEFAEAINLPQPLEYKYVRGEWADVELDQYGNSTANRKINDPKGIYQDYVPLWRTRGLEYSPRYLPDIRIISEEFDMPQLIKTRRVAALLPNDYNQRPDKKYPVLYLQDGQNLFDDYAPFGSWGVDKKLALLKEQGMGDLIVISIDHAEDKRLEEFTPSFRTRLGKGDGQKYVRFLTQTLKPYIDENFRTLPDKVNTGIGGSSMGGLISIYAGLIFPEVYGKLMIFSPSLWVAPNIHFNTMKMIRPQDIDIYLYAGGKESRFMVNNVKNFKQTLEKRGINSNIEFKLSIDPNGKHNEARWGEEFPKAVKWLFFDAREESD